MQSIRLMCIAFAMYAFFVFVGIHKLDAATATQCRNHDWPVAQDSTHLMWCLDNGYPTH